MPGLQITKRPDFELFERFPLTDNDPDITARVATAFAAHFGDRSTAMPMQTASEDFGDIPTALGVPYTYWGFGGIDPDTYRKAEQAGRVSQDIPVNHSATFATVLQPTLDTGTEARRRTGVAVTRERVMMTVGACRSPVVGLL